MLKPRCTCTSHEAEMIFAVTGRSVYTCLSVPARSTQSSASTTSASRTARVAASERKVPGGPTKSGCRVGKFAPTLRSVTARAPSFSASATRARQLSIVRWLRPIMMTGDAAPDRSAAARAIASGAGCGASGARNRDGSGSGGRSPSFASCRAASRFT